MTFYAWARTQVRRDDPVGDFCRDWCADRDRPSIRRSSRWRHVRYYLWQVGACDAAVQAGKRAYAEWRETLVP